MSSSRMFTVSDTHPLTTKDGLRVLQLMQMHRMLMQQKLSLHYLYNYAGDERTTTVVEEIVSSMLILLLLIIR